MSKRAGKRIDLRFNESKVETPTFWLTEGSKFRRSSAVLELAEDQEMQDALPPDSTRPVIFRQVQMLTPGNWNGLEDVWTEPLIQACANNFSGPRPLQADHSRRADDNHGKVFDLLHIPAGIVHENPAMVGLVGVMGAHAIERVEDGRWDQFSVGVWAAQNVEESHLIELSFTPFPACDETRFLTEDENTQEEEGIMPKPTDMKVLQGQGAQGAADNDAKNGFFEGLAKLFSQYFGGGQQQQLTEGTPVAGEALSAGMDPEVQARLDAQAAEIEQLKAKQAEGEEIRLTEQVRAEVLELVREGYSAPAAFEKEVALLRKMGPEERAEYLELKREQPRVWFPGRQSDPKQALSAGKREELKADEDYDRIKALMKPAKATA